MIQSHAILSKLKMARISAQDRARIVGLVEGGMPYKQVNVFETTNIHKDNKKKIGAELTESVFPYCISIFYLSHSVLTLCE